MSTNTFALCEDTDVNGYISTAPDWHAVSFTRVRLNKANHAVGALVPGPPPASASPKPSPAAR